MPEVTQEYLTKLRWDMHNVIDDDEDKEPSLVLGLAELNALINAAERYLITRPLVDVVPPMSRPDWESLKMPPVEEIQAFWDTYDEVQERLAEWDS